LRDHAVEIVVIDSDEGYEHFRPLFDNSDGAYSRAVFITDSDVDPNSIKTDEELRVPFDPSFDLELNIDGNTAISEGYGTFEFCLVRSAGGDTPNIAMQSHLESALKECKQVSEEKQNNFVHDFLDFEKPSLAYKKMKEKKRNTYITDVTNWYGDQHTNSDFRSAKSDFAFYLNERLALLSNEDLSKELTLPKYIEDAIRFVMPELPTSEEEEPVDGADR
jgi:hypothetical protein